MGVGEKEKGKPIDHKIVEIATKYMVARLENDLMCLDIIYFLPTPYSEHITFYVLGSAGFGILLLK